MAHGSRRHVRAVSDAPRSIAATTEDGQRRLKAFLSVSQEEDIEWRYDEDEEDEFRSTKMHAETMP